MNHVSKDNIKMSPLDLNKTFHGYSNPEVSFVKRELRFNPY